MMPLSKQLYQIGLVSSPNGVASEVQGPFTTASQAAMAAERLNADARNVWPRWKWSRLNEIPLDDGTKYFVIVQNGTTYTVLGSFDTKQEAENAKPINGYLVSTLCD